ncbi:MAG: hypothetical protein M3N46_13015 [Actinomycetota bacterium]|nr:hypothetical protein [Actinomycetota bacterium]
MSMVSPTVGSGHANEVLLKQLGEVTVESSRLEHLAVELGRHLKIQVAIADAVPTLQTTPLTPPPWSTITAKDVAAWAASTSRLLEIRDRMFAASGGSRFAGGRGDTIATESADGTVFPADEEYLVRYLKRLQRQLAAGIELESRLDYHDENGQRWPLVTIYAQHAAAGEGDEPALKLPSEWHRWLSA